MAEERAAPDSAGLPAGLLDARVVLVTGKGGVGKTTVAAALAQLAGKAGRRVLVAEVGQKPGAHSPLLEALGSKNPIGYEEPFPVQPNVDAAILTPEAGHRAFLRDVLPMGFLADRALKAEPLKRFLSAAPAFSELGVLYRALQFIREQHRGKPRYDFLVIDAPASGHALAFATLPEVVLRIIPGGPIGKAVREGLEIFTDPKLTRAVVTTLPETLPVSEALELIAGLERSKVQVGAVIANQIPDDPFSADERAALAPFLGSPLMGSRMLARLDRARAAINRLEESVGRVLHKVEEHAGRGPALVHAVAAQLTRSP